GTNVPREHQARGWFPREYAAPVTGAPVVAALVPAAPDSRLDHRVHRLRLANLVGCQRPPRAHPFGKYLPSHLRRRPDAHNLPHPFRVGTFELCLLRHRGFPSLVASCSAASLNAASPSPQNPSSQLRSALMPRASPSYSRRVPSAQTMTSPA